jgi:hypothetical protein
MRSNNKNEDYYYYYYYYYYIVPLSLLTIDLNTFYNICNHNNSSPYSICIPNYVKFGLKYYTSQNLNSA